MSVIRVVTGSGGGPTELAAYDAALADAGVANYNLVTVSSVLPADTPVEVVDTAPDLGPAGHRLTVVQARGVSSAPGTVAAALGWTRQANEGPGVFYEAAGDAPASDLEQRVRRGIEAGLAVREWTAPAPTVVTETATSDGNRCTAAVALGIYGTGSAIV